MREYSILVIQLARFGDFLQTTPLLAALKAGGPHVRLSLMVNTSQAALAKNNPDVDEVLSADLSGWEKTARSDISFVDKVSELAREIQGIRPREFDLVINLNTSRLAALLAGLIRAGERRGPGLGPDRRELTAAPWADLIMSLMTRRRLIRFNLVDLLASYAAGPRVSSSLTYPVRPQALGQAGDVLPGKGPGPLIGFQLGSRHVSRQWPPDYYARLIWELMEKRQARPVLLGLENERPLGAEVKARLSDIRADAPDRVVDLMGRTSLETLGGVVSSLDLLVGGDTGTMHLAAATRTKILALFIGPAWCHETGPYGAGNIILQTDMPCSPCTEGQAGCGDHPCRRLIEPDAAFRAAVALLNDHTLGLESIGPVEVRAFKSDLDPFGVVFLPLTRKALNGEEALALALREAGREYIRPGYVFEQDAFRRELGLYLPGQVQALEAPIDLSTPPLPRILSGMAGRGEQNQAAKFVKTMDRAAALARDYMEKGF